MWRGRSDDDDSGDNSFEGMAERRAGRIPDIRHASPEELRNDIRAGKIRRIGGSDDDPTFSTGPNGTADHGGPGGYGRSPNGIGKHDAAGAFSAPGGNPDGGDSRTPDWRVERVEMPAPTQDNSAVSRQATSGLDGGEKERRPSPQQPGDLGVFTNADGRHGGDSGPPTAAMSSLQPMGAEGPDGPDDSPYGVREPQRNVPPHPADVGHGYGPGRGGLRAVDSPSRGGQRPWAAADDSWPDSWSLRPGADGSADQPRPPKLELAPPVESAPNRSPLFALGALAVLLGLGAFYYFVVRDDGSPVDDGSLAVEEPDQTGSADQPAGGDAAANGDGAEVEADDSMTADEPAGPTSLDPNPVLMLEGADSGPLETETPYPTELNGAPVDSQYVVIVDGREQGDAIDYLPDLVLPEGRHSIVMEVAYEGETATTNPVEVYVLAPELVASYRANLSSVSVQDEGWGEALRQFDEFRASGHEQLRLSPSDPYPSLLPGFWNIYVDGFSSRDEAAAYCESSGLSIPDQCFPSPFDPDAPAQNG